MKSRLRYFAALLGIVLTVGNAYGLSGSWRGELNLGQMKLPLVFNFSENASGEQQCTLDSPSQGAKGIPATVVFCTADSLSVTCGAIGASYCGRIASGTITGTFKQRGYSFPLNLLPEVSVEERRPQTPKPPYPYQVIDTVFTAPDGAVMGATLTIPLNANSKKIPAVVMVTGSGPQNRDEELFEHKPFAVIADYLARKGIASLRYDDRGTGQSTGNFVTATTHTFKDDAMGGITFLRTFPYVGKVGVLGHSEGGTIAFMLGAENKADFVISLAGMAISGKETLLRQNSHALDRFGLSEEDKANSLKFIGKGFDVIAEQVRKGVSEPIDIDSLARSIGVTVIPQIVSSLKMTQQTRTPWFDSFVSLNPRDYLKSIRCPLLAVNGEKDTQVYPDNLSVIRELVPQAKTMLMPELNHLMQHAVTGEVSEYSEIRETISPEVLDAVTQFILTLK